MNRIIFDKELYYKDKLTGNKAIDDIIKCIKWVNDNNGKEVVYRIDKKYVEKTRNNNILVFKDKTSKLNIPFIQKKWTRVAK